MDDRYIWAIAPIAICNSIAGGILVAIPFDATACDNCVLFMTIGIMMLTVYHDTYHIYNDAATMSAQRGW